MSGYLDLSWLGRSPGIQVKTCKQIEKDARKELRRNVVRKVILSVSIIVCILVITLLLSSCVTINIDPKNNGRVRIPRSELLRIQRYHGTKALRITGEKIEIWRDGGWIKVRRKI